MNNEIDTEITKEELGKCIESMVSRFDAELFALSAEEIAAEWFWRWETNRSKEWNTYQFSDILELHKRRWRRWEEHHNGSSCVVERVRDKYVMPRVSEFLLALENNVSNNPDTKKSCMNCGTAYCDRGDAYRCGSESKLWTPRNNQ
jgi:hypothetical protein